MEIMQNMCQKCHNITWCLSI